MKIITSTAVIIGIFALGFWLGAGFGITTQSRRSSAFMVSQMIFVNGVLSDKSEKPDTASCDLLYLATKLTDGRAQNLLDKKALVPALIFNPFSSGYTQSLEASNQSYLARHPVN